MNNLIPSFIFIKKKNLTPNQSWIHKWIRHVFSELERKYQAHKRSQFVRTEMKPEVTISTPEMESSGICTPLSTSFSTCHSSLSSSSHVSLLPPPPFLLIPPHPLLHFPPLHSCTSRDIDQGINRKYWCKIRREEEEAPELLGIYRYKVIDSYFVCSSSLKKVET